MESSYRNTLRNIILTYIMPIVAHYIAESKHLFFHSGDFPQWLRLFKKNGRKRLGAGGMCGRRAAEKMWKI